MWLVSSVSAECILVTLKQGTGFQVEKAHSDGKKGHMERKGARNQVFFRYHTHEGDILQGHKMKLQEKY